MAQILSPLKQLKGKIVSALLHTFFRKHFQNFSPRTSLKIKAFLLESKKKKTKPFCTLIVARLSSSKLKGTNLKGQTEILANYR